MAKTFTEFKIILNEDSQIEVEYTWDNGLMVSFVVRLMHREPQGCQCVARYDNAHGTPHIDILKLNGDLHRKLWYGTLTNAEALDHAIADFKQNYEIYLAEFFKS